MIAVTIAVGAKFRALALGAAEAVKRHYKIDHVVTLGREQLARWCAPADRYPVPGEHVWSLKHQIDRIFPALERWLYFDADYKVVNPPDPDVVDALHSDTRFIGVEDTDTDPAWRASCPPGFLNAGFFVANRAEHERVFAWCRENYWTVPDRRWGDQNVMNAALNALKCPKLVLPLKYNVMKTAKHLCPEPVGAHGYWYTH